SARGLQFSASARDDQKPIEGVSGRIVRANANFKETYVFFVALVLAGALLHRHSTLTVVGAQLYFWSRIVYWPLYVAGVPLIRSLVWLVSLLGLVLLLVGVA
ncbi:MAG TPA: MAPEG family protein, partial [Acidisoma sp.]|nr:MAPEG family protein [Acidisoma sp.]